MGAHRMTLSSEEIDLLVTALVYLETDYLKIYPKGKRYEHILPVSNLRSKILHEKKRQEKVI